jgi:hypothetical protein
MKPPAKTMAQSKANGILIAIQDTACLSAQQWLVRLSSSSPGVNKPPNRLPAPQGANRSPNLGFQLVCGSKLGYLLRQRGDRAPMQPQLLLRRRRVWPLDRLSEYVMSCEGVPSYHANPKSYVSSHPQSPQRNSSQRLRVAHPSGVLPAPLQWRLIDPD